MHWRRQRKYSKHFGKSYFLKAETNVKFEFSRGFSAVPVCFKSRNLYFRLSTPSRGRVNFCQKIKSSTFTLFINSIKVNFSDKFCCYRRMFEYFFSPIVGRALKIICLLNISGFFETCSAKHELSFLHIIYRLKFYTSHLNNVYALMLA